MMDRKSSIENEPRTLGADQLQFAREAALYVIHSRSMEDALRVFTEGLEPVVGARQRDEDGICSAKGYRIVALLSERSEPSVNPFISCLTFWIRSNISTLLDVLYCKFIHWVKRWTK